MTVGATMFVRPGSLTRLLGVGAAVTCWAGSAGAIVVEGMNSLPAPANGHLGQWNGSSAVAIAPQWLLSALHVGGAPGGLCIVQGGWYQVDEIRSNAALDLQLLHVSAPLPGWHQIGPSPTPGQQVVLGGCGATTAAAVLGNLGWDWYGPHVETWGTNTVEAVGATIRTRFDAPSAPGALPNEAAFAVNDSGGGLFIQAPDGRLLLTGIAVSASGVGVSLYGTANYCIDLAAARSWIDETTGSNSGPTIEDLFRFLSQWFAGDLSADFDHSGALDVADIFAYLTAWFQG